MFNCRLAEIQKIKGITDAEIELKTGISRVSLWKMKSFPYNPRLATVTKLSKFLGVSISELFVSISVSD